MKKKYKIISFVVVAVICLVAYGGSTMKPKVVEGELVVRENLGTSFTIQGTLQPNRSEILNAASAGVMKENPYQVGSKVSQGEVILRMGYESRADLEIQREQYRQQLTSARQTYERLFGVNGTAKANLLTAQSDYDLAEKNYQNGRMLVGQSLSQMELNVLANRKNQEKQGLIQAQEEDSESNRSYYQQLIDSYEKQLIAMENSVNPGEIIMPYDGVIWEIYQEEGAYVAANQPVAKVYQPGDMKLQASLLSEDAIQLKPGQTASCKYADGSVVDAQIQFISNVAGQTLSTIGMEENRCNVELKPQQVPEGVGAGYWADITFSMVAAEEVLAVSLSALVTDVDGDAVYVLENGKAVLRTVETGKKSGGRVEISSGLNDGDWVVSDPYEEGVKEGSRIKGKEYMIYKEGETS